MTDLFSQEGITFEHAGMASTAPSTSPDPITAPKVNIEPSQGAPAPAGSMSPEDKRTALEGLYGDNQEQAPAPQMPQGNGESAPIAPATPVTGGGVDLFEQEGLTPPSIEQRNANALSDGIPLNTPAPAPIGSLANPYGLREDGTPKGRGFFGELKRPDGSISTELSVGVNIDGAETQIPALVPTLTKEEVDYLLAGNDPSPAILDKAVAHAKERMSQNKSPFASDAEAPLKNDSWKPVSRAQMSLPPDMQSDYIAKQKAAQDYAAEDQKRMMDLAKARFTPDQIQQWKDNPISFSEAFSKLHPNQVLPGGGFSQFADSMAIVKIGDKVKAGEDLTPEDQKTMNDYINEKIELGIRGFSWGGKIAYIGSQIPAFAVEFAISDGAGKLAQTATATAVEQATARAALATAGGVASRVATTTTLMPSQYFAKYGERRLNDVSAITDKGELVFRTGEESPATSALLAFAHTGADAAAQIAAPTIGKYLVNPATKLVSTPLIAAVNKLPTETKLAMYEAYKVIQPNAKVSQVFTKAGWAGMLEQLGANRVAEILNATIDLESDKKMTMDEYLDRLVPSKDQLLVEGGLVAIAGGVHTASSVAFNLMRAKGLSVEKATEAVDNMTAMEKESYVNENLPMPQSPYPPAPERYDGDLPEEQKAQYVQSYQSRIDALLKPADTGAKKPLIAFIKEKGGVSPSSSLASELGNIGVTAKTAPGLYNKAGTAGDLDNIPATEFNSRFGVTAPEDGNGYVDRNWLLEQIRNEMAGKRLVEPEQAHDEDFIKALGDEGIDYKAATGEQVYAAFGPDMMIKREGFFQGENLSPRDVLAIRQFIEENPHYSMENAVSQFVERQAIMVHGDIAPRMLKDSISYDADVIRKQMKAAEVDEPPPINDEESIFNYLNRALFNDKAAAEEPFNNAIDQGFTPKQMDNTPLLMSLNHQTPELVRAHLMLGTFKWNKDGNIEQTGKSLKSILDDVDNYFLTREPNRETRRKDFEDYLIARHYLSLPETAPHVMVTPEQAAKSTADIERLTEKFGTDIKMMETLADEFVAFRNRTRDLLVGNLLTPAQRAEEKKMFPYSVPLKREMEAPEYQEAVARGDYSGLNPGNLTKHLKGSALPVKNILHSTLRETARVIDFVQRNRVNESIFNLRKYAPDKVQKTKLPIVKKGTVEFEHSFDPKLRSKLEETIHFLGGQLERTETLHGKRGILGSYSPEELMVRAKLGSTEGTLSHEVGHMLDHRLELKRRLLTKEGVRAELRKLAEDRLGGEFELEPTEEGMRFNEMREEAPDSYMKYIRNDDEILANMFDAYVNSPEQLERIAPRAKAEFEKIIDKAPDLAFIREIKPSTNRGVEKIKKDLYGHGDLPPNTFAFWKDGKKNYVKVSKPMFESLSSMRASQLSNAAKFFNTTLRLLSSARLLTAGATITPEFAMRNVVKDSLEATVQSGVKYNAAYIPKSLAGMLTKSKEYTDFIESGGKFARFMALDDGNIEHTFEDILNPKSTFQKLIRNPLEAYEKIPKASETLTRFGIYRAALDKGFSSIEAAQYALDATLNFPRGGFAIKAANRYIPFLNVGFLATEKLVRAFKEDPKTMTIRGVTYLTAPALIISGYYLYGADEETRKAWQEIPQDRISSGQIPFAYNKETGQWRYIPTPYALGYMFAGLPMLALRQIHGNNPDDGKALWETLIHGFAGAVSPVNEWSSLIPPTLKVAIEDVTNYDFFRERPIYSKFKDGPGVLNKDKVNAYDTETAKAIGNFFNASPALIDHTVYGLLGSSAGYILGASDSAINAKRKAEGTPVPEKPKTGADTIGVRAFTMRAPEGTRSNSYRGFEQHFFDVQAISGHLKSMADGPDKADYANENARVLSQAGQLKEAHKQIDSRSKEIRSIYADVHMGGEQKATRIAVLEREITRIARNANNQYNAAAKAGK